MNRTTKTMHAIVQDTFGGPEVLKWQTVPQPTPLPTEIVVKVEAAGVNRVDWLTRAGQGMVDATGNPPFTVGWDVAGVVTEIAPGVTAYKVGERVAGLIAFPKLAGGYAEYICAPARQFVPIPPQLSFEQAATLPLPATTAWQALIDTAHLQAGDRVLIHGAGGGVGFLAAQIAKAKGAHVIAVAAERHKVLLKSIGIDEFIDYKAQTFEKAVTGIDIALDLVGKDISARSIAVMKPHGTLVCLAPPTKEFASDAQKHKVNATIMLVEPDRVAMGEIMKLIISGDLRAHTPKIIPMRHASEAHKIGEQGEAPKMVLVPNE